MSMSALDAEERPATIPVPLPVSVPVPEQPTTFTEKPTETQQQTVDTTAAAGSEDERVSSSESETLIGALQHPLESALDLASALALGSFWGTHEPQVSGHVVYISSGEAVYTGVKLGPESWWSIFYIGPSLFSIVAIIYLLRATRYDLPKWDKVGKLFHR